MLLSQGSHKVWEIEKCLEFLGLELKVIEFGYSNMENGKGSIWAGKLKTLHLL